MKNELSFFRVHIGPATTFKGALAWVREAKDPQETLDRKASVFRFLSLTDSPDEAQVYPEATAAAIISVLRTTYPAAELAPATFDEWVEAAGVGSQ